MHNDPYGDPSEYQVEYCRKPGVKIGTSARRYNAGEKLKNLEIQPVGGRFQERYRRAVMGETARQNVAKRMDMPCVYYHRGNRTGGGCPNGLPVFDEDFVTQQYNAADRGTHRVAPQWRDPRWSSEMRAGTSTLYEATDRDIPNRNNNRVYRSCLVNHKETPARPLTVPDVHKLRYMHNEYMTPDDWY